MSDELKPVLTADEWREIRGEFAPPYWIDSNVESMSDTERVEAIAVLNDALPDGSPYKITRHDVELVAAMADDNKFRAVEDELRTLAAKLAALRPPDNVIDGLARITSTT